MNQVRFTSGDTDIIAELEDTPSVRALLRILPCESSANAWGEEIYFSVPLSIDLEANARQVVEPGTVCLWVEGNSIALPYGPTPISEGSECRLISQVNILGKILGDPRQLDQINPGDKILVELVQK